MNTRPPSGRGGSHDRTRMDGGRDGVPGRGVAKAGMRLGAQELGGRERERCIGEATAARSGLASTTRLVGTLVGWPSAAAKAADRGEHSEIPSCWRLVWSCSHGAGGTQATLIFHFGTPPCTDSTRASGYMKINQHGNAGAAVCHAAQSTGEQHTIWMVDVRAGGLGAGRMGW